MISYVLAPNPVLQLTDAEGRYVPYGTVQTLDWDTRQPKATYFDPGGLKPRSNPFQLDQVGRAFTVYWEDDSAYYLVLRDRNGNIVWQSAEPYVPSGGGGSIVTNNIEFENLFLNGQMRFFPVGLYEPIPDGTTLNVAEGGWSFEKDGTNLTDKIEFVRFTLDESAIDATPIYYFNYVSTAAGSMETQKSFNFRIQDVRSLSAEEVTISVEARSDLMGVVPLELVAVQNFGSPSTGVTPSDPVITPLTTFNLTTDWERYSFTVILPNLIGKTLGENGDDFLSFEFGMPLNAAANIQLTNFYLKRGASAANYPYQTYAEVQSELTIIPRHSFYSNFPDDATVYPTEQAYDALSILPKGEGGITELAWLPTLPIGSMLPFPSDIAPPGWIVADGEALIKNGAFNRLFNVPFSGGKVFGNAYGTVSNNVQGIAGGWGGNLAQLLLRTTTIGVSPTWAAGNAPFTFLRVTIGHDLEGIEVTADVGNTITFRNTAVGAHGSPLTNTGMVINVINPGSPTEPQEWDITGIAATSIGAGTNVDYQTSTGNFYIWFKKDGVGTDPALAGYTGHEVNISTGFTANEIAAVVKNAISGIESWAITFVAASLISPGAYFIVGLVGAVSYALYYRIDGSINFPVGLGIQLIPIDILSTDTAEEVAVKTLDACNPLLWKMPDWRGAFIRFWDNGRGLDPDSATRLDRGDGTVGDNVGTYQEDENLSHAHTLGGYFVGSKDDSGGTPGTLNVGTATLDTTELSGGLESRPKNYYFNCIVKY